MKIYIPYIAGLLAFMIWIAWAFQSLIILHLGIEWKPEIFGQWGDTFGALNTLFGACGLSAVLWTLYQQNQSISLQAKDQHRQHFDNTFFQLLSYIKSSRDSLNYSDTRTEKKLIGNSAFEAAAENGIRIIELSLNRATEIKTREEIGEIYKSQIHNKNDDFFGPHFRLIYNILDRIHKDTTLEPKEKISYGNLVRSQFGPSEVGLLALNGLMKESGNLTLYIEEFRMLKYLPENKIKELTVKHYDNKAFEARND